MDFYHGKYRSKSPFPSIHLRHTGCYFKVWGFQFERDLLDPPKFNLLRNGCCFFCSVVVRVKLMVDFVVLNIDYDGQIPSHGKCVSSSSDFSKSS